MLLVPASSLAALQVPHSHRKPLRDASPRSWARVSHLLSLHLA